VNVCRNVHCGHRSPRRSRTAAWCANTHSFNARRLNTTLVAVITSNTRLAAMPGNVFVPATTAGLPKDSVVDVTALVTPDKSDLRAEAGDLPGSLMHEVDRGLRSILSL
jgi:mRNA interferase MazF